jgi:predicted PurR-regulated permease PerM
MDQGSPMIELTPRERRWLDATIVLAALALAFVVLGFVGQILTYFSDLIFVFFLAWLLAFMLSPIVSRLRAAIPVLSRAGAVFAVYFVLFGGLIIVTVAVATALFGGVSSFLANVPHLRDDLPAILQPWQDRLRGFGITQINLLATATNFLDNVSDYAAQLVQPLQQLAFASLGAIGNLLLVIVLSLYMVADRERLVAFLFWLVPSGNKEEARLLEEAVARSFGGFIRGQAIIGVVFAMVSLLASAIFGLDYAALTTAAAGVLMAIPFFGPFVSWLPPVLVAFTTKPDAVLPTLIVVVIGWLLVMNALQPRIMANALRIHPIVVLGSVLVGLKVAGISGAIFGIPVAAVISALFLHLLGRRREGGPVAERAAARVGAREGRLIRTPVEPRPGIDRDVEPAEPIV